MKKVLAIILGGGAGTRLYPLTKLRAKPAVPLAGKYRYKINTKGVRDEKPEKSNPWSDIADAFQYMCLHADGGEVFGAMSFNAQRKEVVKVSAAGWT